MRNKENNEPRETSCNGEATSRQKRFFSERERERVCTDCCGRMPREAYNTRAVSKCFAARTSVYINLSPMIAYLCRQHLAVWISNWSPRVIPLTTAAMIQLYVRYTTRDYRTHPSTAWRLWSAESFTRISPNSERCGDYNTCSRGYR